MSLVLSIMKVPTMESDHIRTTVVLSEKDRQLIRASGKTMTDFFGELLLLYKDLSVNTWTDGSYVIGMDRFCLMNQRNLQRILSSCRTSDKKELGSAIGTGFRESLVMEESRISMDELVERFNKMLRWGRICSQNTHRRIVLRDPIVPDVDFNKSFLEHYFGVSLEVADPNTYRQVFEVKDR